MIAIPSRFRTHSVSTLAVWLVTACLGLSSAKAALLTNGQQIHIYTVSTQLAAQPSPLASYGYSGDAQELVITNSASVFQYKSFCLEENEFFTPGAGSTYTVYGLHTTSADAGGVSGGNPDPISNATASLFVAYANNLLNTVDLGAPGGADDFQYQNNDWAAAVQLAIWRLEGERSATYGALINLPGPSYPAAEIAKADEIYNYFTNALNVANPFSNYGGTDVDVVNIKDANGALAQSFLQLRDTRAELPVPEPTSMLVWGLGAAMAFGYARSRRNNSKSV